MMSILEYLEWRGVVIEDHEERIWWVGWEDAHCMGRSYDGWRDLAHAGDDERYERNADLVVEYLLYCKQVVDGVSDHYVHNVPGQSYESDVRGYQIGGSYE